MFDSKVKSTKGFKFKLEIQIKRKEQQTSDGPNHCHAAQLLQPRGHSSIPTRPLLSP